MNAKHSHLTSDDRIRIETFIAEGRSVRYIADRLDKAPSTISRELKKHVRIIINASRSAGILFIANLTHVMSVTNISADSWKYAQKNSISALFSVS